MMIEATYDKFQRLVEILGEKEMLENVYRYFGDWKMEDCIQSIATDFDIHIQEEDDDN